GIFSPSLYQLSYRAGNGGNERGFWHSFPRISRRADGLRARAGARRGVGDRDRACGVGGNRRGLAGRRALHEAEGGADLLVDLGGEVGVVLEEDARVLAPLAEADLAVGEPRAGFLDDAVRDAEVEEIAFLRNAFAVEDVELGRAERRRDFVLHDA